MKERFEGTGLPLLVESLKRQELIGTDAKLARAFAKYGIVCEYRKGDKLMSEGGEDNDFYLIVAGSVTIVARGNEIGTRSAGQQVGEMSAIEPSQLRAATVVANETVVALKVANPDLMRIGKKFPQIWLPVARELSRRLYQSNALIPKPNEFPKLFIISSNEALPVAHELRNQLGSDVFSTVWDQGVFFAGGYPLESLETAVSDSDFAVAIAQPDDIVESRGSRSLTLRDNVLFELGLFMGKLTRYRAILLHPSIERPKLPSDLHGMTVLSYIPGSGDELSSGLRQACNEIRTIVANQGVRTLIRAAEPRTFTA